jgi:hypothetical protein
MHHQGVSHPPDPPWDISAEKKALYALFTPSGQARNAVQAGKPMTVRGEGTPQMEPCSAVGVLPPVQFFSAEVSCGGPGVQNPQGIAWIGRGVSAAAARADGSRRGPEGRAHPAQISPSLRNSAFTSTWGLAPTCPITSRAATMPMRAATASDWPVAMP